MALYKEVSLVIRTQATAQGDQWTWTETDFAELHIDFAIHRTTVFNANTAEFTIYNASKNQRAEILKRGSNLLFSAGYEDQGIGLIFSGQIIAATSHKAGSDWITKIEAQTMRSTEKPFQITPVGLSYAPGVSLIKPVEYLAETLGLVPIGMSNIDFPMPNGFAFAGSADLAFKKLHKIIKSHGRDLFVDNTEIIAYIPGQASEFTAVYLTPDSGLLNAVETTAEATDLTKESIQVVLNEANLVDVYDAISDNVQATSKQVEIESLLHSKARPNGLVTLSESDQDGTYLIEEVKHQGNNYSGDFKTTIYGSAE